MQPVYKTVLKAQQRVLVYSRRECVRDKHAGLCRVRVLAPAMARALVRKFYTELPSISQPHTRLDIRVQREFSVYSSQRAKTQERGKSARISHQAQ